MGSSGKEEAAPVQTGNACIVCWRVPADRAHVIDRSLAPDPFNHARRVVRLCREHHDAYDNHTLDLLPYLEPAHRHELARAVELVGLITTLERVTGRQWTPCGPLKCRRCEKKAPSYCNACMTDMHGEVQDRDDALAVLRQGKDHVDLFGGRVDV